MARKEFRPRRKQYEEKNPMAAFWEQTAQQYEKQSRAAPAPGLRAWANERANACWSRAQEARISA